MPYVPAHQIDASFLDQLVQAAAIEDEHLEFKRDMYDAGDKGRREITRDVIAMANGKGGLILVGVGEDENGGAAEVVGVEGSGHTERIRSVLTAHARPPLPAYEVVQLAIGSSRSVIIIDVPKSYRSPHMSTVDGENRFWLRTGAQRHAMGVEELAHAFAEQFGIGDLATNRLSRRVSEIYSLENVPADPSHFWLLLQANPAVRLGDAVNIRDDSILQLLRRPPRHPHGYHDCAAGSVRPSLLGLKCEPGIGASQRKWLELSRDGYLEYVERFDHQPSKSGHNAIPSGYIVQVVYSFVLLYAALCERVSVTAPSVYGLSLLGVKGSTLGVPQSERSFPDDVHPWSTGSLSLPALYFENIQDTNAVMREINDRLWNAFGLTHCTYFGKDGALSA